MLATSYLHMTCIFDQMPRAESVQVMIFCGDFTFFNQYSGHHKLIMKINADDVSPNDDIIFNQTLLWRIVYLEAV